MKKLSLRRETLRTLDAHQMQTVQGGTLLIDAQREGLVGSGGPIIPPSHVCPTSADLTSVIRPGGRG